MCTTNEEYKNMFESERRTRGKRCHMCGSYQRIGEFAHRVHFSEQPLQKQKGSGRGRNNRIIGIIRFPEKYILLCHDCHVEYDYKNNYDVMYRGLVC